MKPIHKKLLFSLAGLLFIVGGTAIAIRYANGYRPTRQGLIQGTGLLAANSFPPGAQVFIDGKLTTATDDTINLNPGEYNVEIKKDGFITWQKTLTVVQELVSQTNATLFPAVVSLTPITQTGVSKVTPSPDGTKLAYLVSNASTPSENGLYVYHLNGSALTFRGRATQITRSIPGLLLESADLLWSPDSSQLLLSFESGNNVLLDASRFNELSAARDVTASLKLLFSQWERELSLQDNQRLLLLPDEMQQIATQSAKNIYFSPDEKRMLYTATASATIPDNLIPPLPASNTQTQTRTLESGGIYVYDLKEDRNFRLGSDTRPAELPDSYIDKINLVSTIQTTAQLTIADESSPSAHLKLQSNSLPETITAFKLQYSPQHLGHYQWFPTSAHLIINQVEGIQVVEYDGTNRATLYSGPRDPGFVYPWPDGSRLIISTNLGADDSVPLNLYAISVK